MLVKDRKLQKTDLSFSTISSLSLKLHLNSLVNDRNIFGSFSKVFGSLRQSSEISGNIRNIRVTLGQVLKNLRKPSENRQKRRHSMSI